MTLKASKPTEIKKRLKCFIYGAPKVGKTTLAAQFPTPYYCDGERGTENYAELLNKSGASVLSTTDISEVLVEIRSLTTEPHHYKTLVIDPITTYESDLIERAEREIEESQEGKPMASSDFRQWSKRDRVLKRMVNMLYKLDMNVFIIAHSKTEYGDQMKKLGTTFDAWKRWPYVFDLSFEMFKQGPKRMLLVRGSRLTNFPEGEKFEASYEAFKERWQGANMDSAAELIVLASPESVAELRRLLTVVSVPSDTTAKWLTKAGVDEFSDMNQSDVDKCIEFLRKKVEV